MRKLDKYQSPSDNKILRGASTSKNISRYQLANRGDVLDVDLMDEVGFDNVTAPGLVLPIWPVQKNWIIQG